jgi:hypothetical protein
MSNQSSSKLLINPSLQNLLFFGNPFANLFPAKRLAIAALAVSDSDHLVVIRIGRRRRFRINRWCDVWLWRLIFLRLGATVTEETGHRS